MCGIWGIVSDKTMDLSCLQRAGNVLKHRGPDDSGIWTHLDNRVGLGHSRLSIIDLSEKAHQPMSNEDDSVWITYNGEVYNFKELRTELEGKHVFTSNSDTEVILHAYEEWGEECVNRFSGMFSFAIWDEKKKKLFIARDRIGKKPLFYYWDKKFFAFASELQGLLALNIPRDVDLSSIHQYLIYQYIPAPGSAFKDVFKLPPAHYLTLQNNDLKIQRYWNINFSGKIAVTDENQLCQEISERLKQAVTRRLISDVPFGAFLSGGVDSSIVVALMSEIMNEPVKTFSIGFEDDTYNELPHARQIASLFKTTHREFVVKFDAMDVLPKLVSHYGEPFADSSALPTFYLSKMTSEFVKVALSGDGGDENFAGYDRYYAFKHLGRLKYIPEPIRVMLLRLLDLGGERDFKSGIKRVKRFIQGSMYYPENRGYIEWMSAFSRDYIQESCGDTMAGLAESEDPYEYLINLFEQSSARDPVERAMETDIHSYLPFDLLVKVDIASMANSLEVRCPFLDHEFMEFAASVPSKFKLNGGIKKYIIKKAFKRKIPDGIFSRKKTGFGVPISKWLRNDLKGYIQDILLSPQSLKRGYFMQKAIRRLLNEHISGKIDNSYKLWTLLMLELWHREFIDA